MKFHDGNGKSSGGIGGGGRSAPISSGSKCRWPCTDSVAMQIKTITWGVIITRNVFQNSTRSGVSRNICSVARSVLNWLTEEFTSRFLSAQHLHVRTSDSHRLSLSTLVFEITTGYAQHETGKSGRIEEDQIQITDSFKGPLLF